MNTEAVWKLVRETADALEFDEAPLIELADDPAALDELRARLAPIAAAIRLLQRKSLEAMQPHLGSRGFARFGERVYRAFPDRKQTVKRELEGELWDHLTPHARQLFNPNYPRWGQLKTVTADYVDPDTGEIGWPAFEARFFDVEEGDITVSEIPASKAPKFIQNAEDRAVQKRD